MTRTWPHDLAAFMIRFGLAAVFMFHGAQKLFGWFGGKGLGPMIEHQGPILGVLISVGEFFGGLGLLLGVLTRFSGASQALIMAGAVYLVHGKNGFALSDGGFEYNLVLGLMALSIAIGGPGRWVILPLPDRLRPWAE